MIVPVYRVEHQKLLHCVESITGQTEEQIEILVVFDGTMHEFASILDHPVFQDSRVHCMDMPHRGVSAARNAGIERAGGEWITFADADDRLTPDAVELLLMGAAEDTDLVTADYMIVYPHKTEPHEFRKTRCEITASGRTDFLREVLNPQTGLGFCWGKLYRRSCIQSRGLFFQEELELAEDAEFVLRYVLGAGKICCIPEIIYYYTVNQNSAVRTFRPDYAGQYEKAMSCIRKVLWERGYEMELGEAYETCVLYHLLLITVNYSFHPQQNKSRKQMITEYKSMTKKLFYSEAIRKGNAKRFSRTRRITVWMIRHGFWNVVWLIAWIRHRQFRF